MKQQELLIEDCFQFIRNGISVKQNPDSGGLPITRIETISKAVVNPIRVGYADIQDGNLGKYEDYILQNGDILMSHINSMKYLGKSAIYEDNPVKLIHGMNLLCLRPIRDKCFPKYINYFFSSGQFKNQLPKISNQSVNQASFPAGKLKKLKINLPPLETQKRIAKILDDAAALRDKTAQLLKEYDLLAQSIFLDMFGDPISNNKNLDKISLKEITNISSGSTPSRKNESNFNGHIPWVKTGEVNSNLILDTEEKITEEGLKSSSCKIYKKGSLIIAMYGQGKTRGRVSVLGVPATTNQACAVLSPSEKMNFTYLYEHIKMVYKDLRSLGRGGGQPNLNAALIKNYKVLNPPAELQNQFAEKIALIEQQKALAKQELQESEDLFNCLLQKAFKGEL